MTKQEPPVIWSGEQLGYGTIRPYLAAAARDEFRGNIHYAFTLPGYKRRRETVFTARLCWFDRIDTPVRIQAVFDGRMETRYFHSGDIFAGSYNSGSTVLNMRECSYCGFSVIFHLKHIRFNYVRVSGGRTLTNFYFHTAEPATGALREMLNALDRIIHDREERDGRARHMLAAICCQLLYEQDKQEKAARSHCAPLALRIKDHLDCNFLNGIDCSTACDALGINRSHASTVFRKNFKITMNAYLLSLRLNAAKNLLDGENTLKIREICELCSFNDTGYFIKLFRKHLGLSPGEYRKRKLREEGRD